MGKIKKNRAELYNKFNSGIQFIQAILLKKEKKYILINSDEDILKGKETHDLVFYLNQLGEGKNKHFSIIPKWCTIR